MSDELHHPGRPLRPEEKAVLATLLGSSFDDIDERLRSCVVEDMADGGMGSIRFVCEQDSRTFSTVVAEAEYVDADGVTVSITVNVDDRGDLYEMDFWKVDFSSLREYPKPERLRLKVR